MWMNCQASRSLYIMNNMNEHFLQAGIFHLIISQTMQGKILIVKSYYIRTKDLQLKS